jgi:hypothetical protein
MGEGKGQEAFWDSVRGSEVWGWVPRGELGWFGGGVCWVRSSGVEGGWGWGGFGGRVLGLVSNKGPQLGREAWQHAEERVRRTVDRGPKEAQGSTWTSLSLFLPPWELPNRSETRNSGPRQLETPSLLLPLSHNHTTHSARPEQKHSKREGPTLAQGWELPPHIPAPSTIHLLLVITWWHSSASGHPSARHRPEITYSLSARKSEMGMGEGKRGGGILYLCM